jgi:hypothetical protein
MEFFLLVFPSWMSNFNGVIEKKVIKEENLWVYLFGFVVLWLGVWSYVRMVLFWELGSLIISSGFGTCYYGRRMLVYIII